MKTELPIQKPNLALVGGTDEAPANTVEKSPAPQRGPIRVFAGKIQDCPALLVDGREFYAAIGEEGNYENWIRRQMVDNGYVPDVDWIDNPCADPYPIRTGKRPKFFHLTLDMAKELAGNEGGKKGKAVKRYLQSFDMYLQAQYALETFPAGGKRWLESRTIPPFPKATANLSTMGKNVEPASSPEPVAASPSTGVPPIFQFDSRTVRTTVEGDVVWFVAKDVFETLDLAWTGTQAVKMIPEDWRGVRKLLTPLENQHGSQGTQEQSFICLNFKAVCKVAFRSTKQPPAQAGGFELRTESPDTRRLNDAS